MHCLHQEVVGYCPNGPALLLSAVLTTLGCLIRTITAASSCSSCSTRSGSKKSALWQPSACVWERFPRNGILRSWLGLSYAVISECPHARQCGYVLT